MYICNADITLFVKNIYKYDNFRLSILIIKIKILPLRYQNMAEIL